MARGRTGHDQRRSGAPPPATPLADTASSAALVTVALLPVALFALALPVEITPIGWLAVGGAFVLLGVTLASALVVAASASRIAGAAAGGLVSLALVWHARELFWEPQAKSVFAVTVAVAGVTLAAAGRRLALGRAPRPWAAGAAAAALALVSLSVGSYLGSGYLRWILLRHARSLGTPLFLVAGDRIDDQALAAEWRGAAPSPITDDRVSGAPVRPPGARSVVFVLVDTLRADALRPWGDGPPLPTFDALAAEGVVFRDVLANSGWTKPSVASYFTGLLPEEHGVRGFADRLPDRHRTLAERFRDAGYRTAAFVTNYQISRASGMAQGFDEHREVRAETLYGARAEHLRAEVERWLVSRRPDAPYFLYLHFLDPHTPYLSGELCRFALPSCQRPAYRAEVEHLDRELGLLLPLLRRALGDPLVFLASDHGEEFGEHGDSGHGHTLHEEIVRVPAILVGSDAPPGTAIDARLEARDFYDLLPRFAEAPFELATWARAHDRELRQSSLFAAQPTAGWHRPYRRRIVSFRVEHGRWTYLRSIYGATEELYDRATDPFERRNLAARESGALAAMAELFRTSRPPWAAAISADATEEFEQLRALGYL